MVIILLEKMLSQKELTLETSYDSACDVLIRGKAGEVLKKIVSKVDSA